MGNSFGHTFKISTFGESHGGAVGVVIDGCPPGITLSLEKIQHALNRRRPGQNSLVSPRLEPDIVQMLSGVESGVTLGTPIMLLVFNQDAKKTDYTHLESLYRPSHGDYTTQLKYGIRAKSGGGRTSARETLGRVAAGSVAEQVLRASWPDLRVVGFVESVKHIHADLSLFAMKELTQQGVDISLVRCPEPLASAKMTDLITQCKDSGDTVGGVIRCLILNPPQGLGSPVFDKFEAELAKGMLSIPAARGFEIGAGFASTAMFGSEHNDAFSMVDGNIVTQTNHSGGVQAGITNGETITFRVPFKPVSTIFREQRTVTSQGEEVAFIAKGRHDPCVLPRAVPIVEAMTWLVLLDQVLRQKSLQE